MSKIKTLALALCAALFAITSVSCSKNEEPAETPEAQTFAGVLTTSLPAMPNFEPITSELNVKINWLNADRTEATVKIDPFTIDTGMPGRGYEIGAMEITGIKCTKDSKGTITLRQDAFECEAGEFHISGSFEGEYKDGKLSFTAIYKPGAMPMDVKSEFKTK